jgi:hypothetical protein
LEKLMNTFFRFLLAACMALMSAMAMAQPVAGVHAVTGFRSAHFGMDATQVHAAIVQDFKPATDAVAVLENPTEKTQIILLRLAKLEPGPGPASVSYILGATSKRLMHINVVWKTDAIPSDEARNKVAAAGVELANYFRNLPWKPGASALGVADGHKGVVLFAGVDPNNAAIELRVSGVTTNGIDGVAAQPTGAAQLVLSYIADATKPDIATIKPGTF